MANHEIIKMFVLKNPVDSNIPYGVNVVEEQTLPSQGKGSSYWFTFVRSLSWFEGRKKITINYGPRPTSSSPGATTSLSENSEGQNFQTMKL